MSKETVQFLKFYSAVLFVPAVFVAVLLYTKNASTAVCGTITTKDSTLMGVEGHLISGWGNTGTTWQDRFFILDKKARYTVSDVSYFSHDVGDRVCFRVKKF